jgi:hypothetical protein
MKKKNYEHIAKRRNNLVAWLITVSLYTVGMLIYVFATKTPELPIAQWTIFIVLMGLIHIPIPDGYGCELNSIIDLSIDRISSPSTRRARAKILALQAKHLEEKDKLRSEIKLDEANDRREKASKVWEAMGE